MSPSIQIWTYKWTQNIKNDGPIEINWIVKQGWFGPSKLKKLKFQILSRKR